MFVGSEFGKRFGKRIGLLQQSTTAFNSRGPGGHPGPPGHRVCEHRGCEHRACEHRVRVHSVSLALVVSLEGFYLVWVGAAEVV